MACLPAIACQQPPHPLQHASNQLPGAGALAARLSMLQGLAPRVTLHRQCDLQLLQRLDGGAEFGYSAVALSGDGELLALCSAAPDCQLSVWHWRKASTQ